MEISLEPVQVSGETLRSEIRGVRPGLSLNSSATSVILGKNASTGIADSSLKRKMARIQILDRFVRLEAMDELHKISINGILIPSASMPLRQDDVISLHAPNCAYSYKVIIKSQLPPSPATKRRAHPISGTDSKRRAHPTSMVDLTEELSCPVCLDLFVDAASLVPCGHTLCRSCIPQLSGVCMTCRVPFQTTIPSLVTDNIVAKLVSTDHFSPDELSNYRSRKGIL